MKIEWEWKGAQPDQPGSCFYCGKHRSLHREGAISTADCPQAAIMRAADELDQKNQALAAWAGWYVMYESQIPKWAREWLETRLERVGAETTKIKGHRFKMLESTEEADAIANRLMEKAKCCPGRPPGHDGLCSAVPIRGDWCPVCGGVAHNGECIRHGCELEKGWGDLNRKLAGDECPHDAVNPESGTCWDCGRTVTEKGSG